MADDSDHAETLRGFRAELKSRVPAPGSELPPQPPFKPKPVKKPDATVDAATWKDTYYAKHPKADANKDGTLTWSEYHAYRKEFDPVPKK